MVWSSCCPRDSQESSPTPQFKSISSLALSLLSGPTLTSVHDYWKNHNFDYMDLCWQSNICFNMLLRFVIAFLLRSNRLLISWLQSPSAVILQTKKRKSVTVSIVSPSICYEVMGPDPMILVFLILSFKHQEASTSFLSSSITGQTEWKPQSEKTNQTDPEWVKLLSRVWLFETPWTVAYQAPLSMGFSRQGYWSGLPLPSPLS